MRLEYRTEVVDGDDRHEITTNLLATMNRYGELGWELVSSCTTGTNYRLFFKRRVEDE
jgi:hypothetical protein